MTLYCLCNLTVNLHFYGCLYLGWTDRDFLSLCLVLQTVFTLLLGPFTFFNAQKTKYLQILTSLMRWIGKN